MQFLLHIIILVLAFISTHEASAQYVPPYTSIVVPITKHSSTPTPLYSVAIMTTYVNMQFMNTNFLIDIDARLIWHDCLLQWNIYPGSCPQDTICTFPVSCEEYQCTDVRSSYSYSAPSCPPVTNSSTLPGWGYCTCPVTVVNPVTGSCGQAQLNYDSFTVNTSNGRNPLAGFYGASPNAACAPSSLFESFPAKVSGVMAFSRSPYSLLTSLFEPLKRSLALCLPSSSSAPGVLFVGSGPYYLLPNSDVDVRSLLSYTPLLTHPGSFGYFIGVKAIFIGRIPIGASLWNTTTKFSTTEPYTKLRTDLYERLVFVFSLATMRIPRARTIAPFGMCLNTKRIKRTQAGLQVPRVVLGLEGGKRWPVYGANSMKQMTKDVACLAFVDGGMETKDAIVLGTFMMEDNLVVFDLQNSTVGFSSSLLLYNKTSCFDFNFTTVGSK